MKAVFVGLMLTACGTDFTDPILRPGANDPRAGTACSDEPVQEFDGANFATVTRLVQDDFTLEVWLKTHQSATGSGAYLGNPIVYADVPAITTDDFGAGILNGKFQMAVGNPDTRVRSSSTITTNQWVHVAATRTRATGVVLVYVNGVLEGVGVGNSNALSASPTMTIGGRSGRDFFLGSMSELRIWETARTQSQLTENMYHRLKGTEPGLVGYYRLDETRGVTVNDASPSQNDATFDSAAKDVGSDPPLCGP